ncbi:MAG: alpha/beta fold hydrolase [Flavobacterium circumlabens]|uniref:alpha/beta hydrolase family protein n=1 Tax=Flavobacterium TaxID=237 RepID=UPI001492CCE4|nr:alpha/beta fold hydrolase [Flavobacterium sp. CLA17]QSB26389.1 alpha/beta hydrolase [Flavobacterium sp. CLA17]
MKKIVLLLVALCNLTFVMAQDITGQWNGILKVPGAQLAVVFNISNKDNVFTATMDSPDQKAFGIPTTSTSFENSTLKVALSNLRIEYEGILGKDNIITGTFKQGGQAFPLNLSREKIEKEKLVRPQEPLKPFPYYTEEVNFENKTAGISLAGTLTLPKKEGVFPVVILISGSGPQNRDEELLGHKPFLVLSDYLTKNGIAVLRFDDRGTAASKGDFKSGTSLDFSTDVEAGVQFLLSRKEIDKKKIGLVGHSEGGLIAPIVAGKSKNIAFIVLLAGPGIEGDQLLLLQQELIAKAKGSSDSAIQKTKEMNQKAFQIVNKYKDPQELKTQITKYITEISKNDPDKPENVTLEEYVNLQVAKITNPWMTYFLRYNPEPVLEKVKCPVLALNGEKDLQVPPKENLEAIKKALTKGGNKNITIKEIPNLNHLFQECKSGSPEEYSKIEQTFSPIAMNEILQWIKVQTK